MMLLKHKKTDLRQFEREMYGFVREVYR